MTHETSREELLAALSSLGVGSKDTKMTTEELMRRLESAFDASQQFSTLIQRTPVDGDSLKKWPTENVVMMFKNAFRGTVTEVMERLNPAVAHQDKKGSRATKDEVFKEMRTSIYALSCMHAGGSKQIFCMDDAHERGIVIEVSFRASWLAYFSSTQVIYRCWIS